MSGYKFTYFDVRAKGETARLLFALKGQEYTDIRVQQSEWPAIKPDTPMGQLPVLEIGSVKLPESVAIIRFLAREFGFMGNTSLEAAQIDVIIEVSEDLFPGIRCMALKKLFSQPEKSAEIKEEFDKNAPTILQKLETALLNNNKGQAYFVGEEITAADIHFFSMIDTITDHEEFSEILDSCPALQGLVERIRNQPNLKKYLESRKKTTV